jgi:hypothetical protein
MKFKRSGTVEIYKNGDHVSKGYVSGIGGIYQNARTIHLHFDGIGTSVKYTDNTIEYSSFPITDHINIFQKQ